MSLISVFNKTCANELSKYGFQKLKGLACFGRIINNEIFQYVMPVNRKSLEKSKKAFTIVSGVFTVYSPALDKGLFENYGKYFIDFEFMDRLPHNDLIRLCDLSYDVSSIQTVVDQSIKGFISIMLPYLDQITTLNDYVSYCKRMNISLLRNAEKMWGDSILLVKTNNHDDFIDEYNSICRSVFGEEYNNYNDADSIRTKKIYYDAIIIDTALSRDKVYADKSLYEQAMQELERRKRNNIQQLQAYGFDVHKLFL